MNRCSKPCTGNHSNGWNRLYETHNLPCSKRTGPNTHQRSRAICMSRDFMKTFQFVRKDRRKPNQAYWINAESLQLAEQFIRKLKIPVHGKGWQIFPDRILTKADGVDVPCV